MDEDTQETHYRELWTEQDASKKYEDEQSLNTTKNSYYSESSYTCDTDNIRGTTRGHETNEKSKSSRPRFDIHEINKIWRLDTRFQILTLIEQMLETEKYTR